MERWNEIATVEFVFPFVQILVKVCEGYNILIAKSINEIPNFEFKFNSQLLREK